MIILNYARFGLRDLGCRVMDIVQIGASVFVHVQRVEARLSMYNNIQASCSAPSPHVTDGYLIAVSGPSRCTPERTTVDGVVSKI